MRGVSQRPIECASDSGLPAYLEAVERRVVELVYDASFPDDFTKLLLAGSWMRRKRGPLGHPLAPFYFTLRSGGALAGDVAKGVGASFLLMFRSLRVLDDVQDGELTGALHRAGEAVAINCGVALFYFGLDTFWSVANEVGGMRGKSLRSILGVHMTRSAVGQYRDLTGRGQRVTPAQALATGVEKSAVFSLLFELAGLCTLSDDGAQLPTEYRVIGDSMAEIQQLVNDVDDLSLGESTDLQTGAWNVPLAILLEGVPENERTARAAGLRGIDAARRREILYESGATERVAELVEAARLRVHAAFAALGRRGPYLALMLGWLDSFVAQYYFPPSLSVAVNIDATDSAELPTEDAALLVGLLAKRTWVGEA